MAFTLSGTTVTQSGTDANLSGLSGISGVATNVRASHTEYVVPYRLVITGTMTQLVNEKLTMTRTTGDFEREIHVNGGTWYWGETETINGETRDRETFPLTFSNRPTNFPNSGKSSLHVSNNGLCVLRGVKIVAAAAMFFDAGGHLIWRNVVVDRSGLEGPPLISTAQWRPNGGAIIDVIGFTLIRGRVFYSGANTNVNFSGFAPTYCDRGIGFRDLANNQDVTVPTGGTINANGILILEDFAPVGNTRDVGAFNGGFIRLINPVKGTDLIINAWNEGTTASDGENEILSDVKFTVLDTAGNPVQDARIYHRDSQNGAPAPWDSDIVYNDLTDANGERQFRVFLGHVTILDSIKTVDFKRSATGADDNYNFAIASYNKALNSSTVDLKGAGVKEATAFLLADTDVTEQDYATALAYNSTAINAEVYDHLKALLVRDYEGQAQTFVTIGGDYGTRNVTLAAGTGEAVVTAGAVTIYTAGAFAGTVSTTGSITVEDGVDITGSTFSSLNLTSGRDLINVTVTGALTFNDNTSANYTMTGSTIGTLANNGTGLLQWSQTGSTVGDQSDGEVNVITAPTPSSMTLSASASTNWAIYDDAGTRVASGQGPTTYNNTAGVDVGTWTVVKHRKGYNSEIYTWSADDGSTNNFVFGEVPLLRPEGGIIYSGGATPGIVVSVNGDNYVEVDVPNRSATAQEIIDAQQDFLSTLPGLDWIYSTGSTSAPVFGVLSGTTFLINITGFQYDSIAGLTPEAAISAVLVSSASHPNIRTDNGGASLVVASDSTVLESLMLETRALARQIDTNNPRATA